MSASPEPLPPIELPQAGPVPLPPPPSNPPIDRDVVEAENYVERVKNRTDTVPHPTVSRGVRADAKRYEWQVVSAFAGGPPPPPALAALIRRVDTLEKETKIRLTKMDNSDRADGVSQPFDEVMAENGDLPTMPPNNFVLLSSASVINGLSNARTNNYFLFYYPEGDQDISFLRKKRAIKKAVGCKLRY